MPALGSLASKGFQSALALSRKLPRGDVLAQAMWFARYGSELWRAQQALSGPTEEVLLRVRRDGFATITDYWSRKQCKAAVTELDELFASRPELVHHAADDRLFGVEHLSAAARAFHDDPLHLLLADAYTGFDNVIAFTMANRISRALPMGSGGGLHRDGFLPELKTLLYLTDVTEENGPFQYCVGSHGTRAILRDISKLHVRFLQNRVPGVVGDEHLRKVTGPAGTLIVFDTRGIHTGMPLRAGKRYALTNYIGRKSQLIEENLLHFAPIATERGVLASTKRDSKRVGA